MLALATTPLDATSSLAPAGAILFQWGISPYCYKVRIAAAYKGVRFDERVHGLDEMSAARRATGTSKTPVICAGDQWVTDSTQILEWLEQRIPLLCRTSGPPEPATRS